MWCCDRGTHFKNKVMRLLNRILRTRHHFTTEYCPQSNGTVEKVCKEVLRACRALLSEFRQKESEWPVAIPLIQSVLNHSVRPSLGNRAPLTVFAGLPADNPLRTVFSADASRTQTIELTSARRLMNVETLLKRMDGIHKEVAERRTRHRDRAVQRHNAKTHVRPINFDVGDFVLVAKRVQNDGHKLRVTWRGPRRVTRAVSDLIYECEDLLSGETALFHANRLKFFADDKLDVTEELLTAMDHNDPHFQKVEELLGLRFNAETGAYEVQVKWLGFDYEDPTWEPLETMQEDIPERLSNFLRDHPDQELVQRAGEAVATE